MQTKSPHNFHLINQNGMIQVPQGTSTKILDETAFGNTLMCRHGYSNDVGLSSLECIVPCYRARWRWQEKVFYKRSIRL